MPTYKLNRSNLSGDVFQQLPEGIKILLGNHASERPLSKKEITSIVRRVATLSSRQNPDQAMEFSVLRDTVLDSCKIGWSARHHGADISCRKAQYLLRSLKGLPVSAAENALKLTTTLASVRILKVLTSAVANAKEDEASEDKLKVTGCFAEKALTLKRIQPKDRGKRHLILKKFSTITITVSDD